MSRRTNDPNHFSLTVFCRAAIAGLACWLGCSGVGCGFGGGGSGNSNFPERVRVINALVDETTAHVEFGEDFNITTEVGYGEISPYLEISEGKVPVRVRVDRSVIPDIDTTVTVSAGTDNTYVLTKSSSASSTTATSTTTVTGTLITDDTDTDTDDGFFRIKFLNLGLDAPGMDVYITEPDVRLSHATPAFTGVAFGAATKSVDIEVGSYRVRITESGDDKVLYDSGTVTFNEKEIRTVAFFQSQDGGRPYEATILVDNN